MDRLAEPLVSPALAAAVDERFRQVDHANRPELPPHDHLGLARLRQVLCVHLAFHDGVRLSVLRKHHFD
jgi:hypothetical protein